MNVTEWRFFYTSEESWEQLLRASKQARKSIDIEQFAFGTEGDIIEELTRVLGERALDNVRVRLLLDSVGSFHFSISPLRRKLEEQGVKIVFHSAVFPRFRSRIFSSFLRDHRKLIIIDESEAQIGGVILEERARMWRDTSVALKGRIVSDCKNAFEILWNRSQKNKPLGPVLTDDGKKVFFLAGNAYHLGDKVLYRQMIRNITEAKRMICITTPYLALTNELKRALVYVRKKEVAVTFLLPERSDNIFSDILSRLYYRWMLKKGIRFFHYTKSILHAKTISIDGRWATVGSSNLDWLSIWWNYELNLVSEHPEFAGEVEKAFEEDIKISKEVTRSTPGWYRFFSHEKN